MATIDAFEDSALLRAWREAGHDEASFLARGPVDLNDYEEHALQTAGVALDRATRKFFTRAKGLLGEREFSMVAGEVKERGPDGRLDDDDEPGDRRNGRGERIKNPTGLTIRLFLHRVAATKSPGILPGFDDPQPLICITSQPRDSMDLPDTPATPRSGKATKQRAMREARQALLAKSIQASTPAERDRMAFTSVALAQVNLPHTDPGPIDYWERRNGDWTFLLTPGLGERTPTGERPRLGCPYGVFPRLTLIHLITEAKRTESRRIKLADTFYGFMKTLGIGDSKQNYRSMREQMTRLLSANLQYIKSARRKLDDGGMLNAAQTENRPIAKDFALWWVDRADDDETAELFQSYVLLDQDFFEAVIGKDNRSIVFPLDLDTVAAIKKSSLQLDLYAWLAYRIYKLGAAGKKEVDVPWVDLHEQFGVDFKELRMFRFKMKDHLANLAKFWRGGLNYEITPEALIVKESPLPVETTKKAKLLAG